MKAFFQEYVVDNPFMLDLRRLHIKSGGKLRNYPWTYYAGFAVAILFLFVLFLTQFRGNVPYDIVFGLHLLVMMIIAPSATYPAYAAEVEKRTWDFVLVSPISTRKIVIGKAITGVTSVLLFHAIATLFEIAQVVINAFYGTTQDNLLRLVGANIFILCVGIFLVSATSLISLRAKRVRTASSLSNLFSFGLFLIGPLMSAMTQDRSGVTVLISPMGPLLNNFDNSTTTFELSTVQIPIYLFASLLCFYLVFINVRKSKV